MSVPRTAPDGAPRYPDHLRERIEAHREWLHESGEVVVRDQLRIAHMLESIVRAELTGAFWIACRPAG